MDIRGRRVLVTGADGFIGSHLCEHLHALGARVRALSLYNSFNSVGWLEELDSALGIEVIAGDVRDKGMMHALMMQMDAVFHLASLIAIPYSYTAPESYVQTNIEGTLNVVQAAREARVSRVVHVSTSEVYGTARKVPITEDHPLQPQSPYSASKIGADAIAMSFRHAYGLPVVIARPFNTYGPRQSARAVIPTIITQLLSAQGRIRLGRLDPTRDFNYVADTCEAITAIAQCDAAVGRVLNIGSGSEIAIGDLAKLIADIVGMKREIELEQERLRPEASEVERLLCDSSELRRLTGWRPKVELRDGLETTIAWFKQPENLKRYKATAYNV